MEEVGKKKASTKPRKQKTQREETPTKEHRVTEAGNTNMVDVTQDVIFSMTNAKARSPRSNPFPYLRFS